MDRLNKKNRHRNYFVFIKLSTIGGIRLVKFKNLKIGTKFTIVAVALIIIALAVAGVISSGRQVDAAMLAIALAFIMGILLVFVRMQISKPLKKTADFARSLACGKLDAQIEIKSQDEIGELSSILGKEIKSVLQTIENSRIIYQKQSEYQALQVDQLVTNLERLSAGDLSCDMQVSEPDGDTQELYTLFAGGK